MSVSPFQASFVAILAEQGKRGKKVFLDLRDFGGLGIMLAGEEPDCPNPRRGLWPTNRIN
jgi:hypothetical protein